MLQTGEYDLAWNLQVEDEVLTRLEAAGKGTVRITDGGNLEMIQLNSTDPNAEVDGERSSGKTTHPSLSDPAVRQALSLLVDRDSVHKYIYGRGGAATPNAVINPAPFRSPNTSYEFSVEKAAAILDKAGWKPGPDGVRAKDGKQLKYLFQTSTNGPRQKTQQIVKQALKKAGIEVELKSVIASVFFSSDVANPDTYPHFYADLQMYTTGPVLPDPQLWMQLFLSTEVAQKSNKWQGRNVVRWRNDAYDKAYNAAQSELDPVKRAALLITCNDLAVSENVLPLIHRAEVSAVGATLTAPRSGWDNDLSFLPDWYREA